MLQLQGKARQLLAKLGRNVSHDDRVVAVVFQFQDVTYPVDFRDQGRLARRNFEMRAKPPRA